MPALDVVKNLLGEAANTPALEACHELAVAAVFNRYRLYDQTASELPAELDFIVTEVTIARYNRIGSEGKSSETVEGYSSTYELDLLKQYDGDIRAVALAKKGADTNKVSLGKVTAL